MAACLTAAACKSFRSGAQAPAKPEEAAEVGLVEPDAMRAEVLDDTPIIVAEVAPEKTDGVEEKFVFPERKVDEPSRAPIEYPNNLIKGIADPDAKKAVKFNFDATPLTEVVPGFAAILNFSYLIDPSVKGAVTMTVDSEMTARETWEVFEHILWLAGAYASKNPGFIHIMPFAKMPKEHRIFATHDPVANVEVAFIQIRYIKSAEVLNNLKPFMTDGASITDIPNSNTLLLVEAPANMPKLRELVERLDTKGEAAWPHICLRCQQVPAETLIEELDALLPVLGLPVTNKGPSGGQIKLTALPRLQVIVASAALPEILKEVENWCRVLDREDQAEKENIFFYNVQHSTAEQLNNALAVFFNTSATTSGKPSSTKSTSAKATAPGSTPTATPERSVPGAPTTTKRKELEPGVQATVFDTPVVVYVDEVQNRLTIKTTHRAYALVAALLSRHDVPPRQVMIEAAIADIRLTESTEFGFSYAAAQKFGSYALSHAMVNTGGVTIPMPGGTTTDNADGTTTTSEGIANGMAMLFKKDANKLAFLTAVAGRGNVRIISAPQIMAATGQEATINVGAKVPIVTGGYSTTSGGDLTQRTYQYQDTGTILTVTPYVTAGNDVQLEIKQEVSSAAIDSAISKDTATILNKQLQTTLVVPDGGTVMMGGLIDTEKTNTNSGVPWLKDVPWIGWAFKTNATSSKRSELLVLITVHVVDKASTTDRLINRYQTALKEIRESIRE
ncbi:MAG: hypothetical protein A3K19_13790 [Lentisphaerae bacterium RIFOXYB12_FULL_65_16]|nr:MAG: hypothetical protein A3K18_00095 [Lentisphaerae bacterium RIFOXYA12_64_32]OGV84221.1 MAG: hypothetical protein A3K19_13790 [Lentisphaerae bacterium RIFOXYB12_FULL_65_16]